MDGSVDSIGDCSLDVDVDIDDSSKDTTFDLTANSSTKCSSLTIGKEKENKDEAFEAKIDLVDNANSESQPSYLNLACCINGYSNLTTYDSKIRQDINKSREVSPIRPSCSNMLRCMKNNALAPPVLHSISKNEIIQEDINNGSLQKNYVQKRTNGSNLATETKQANEIQQRVEQLYGPGAFVPNFYSPKKGNPKKAVALKSSSYENNEENELALKFKQLSFGKDYNKFKEKRDASLIGEKKIPISAENSNSTRFDLPCLRHLSPEFREQLSIISPKSNSRPEIISPVISTDEVDKKTMDEYSPIKMLSMEKSTNGYDIKNVLNDASKPDCEIYKTSKTVDILFTANNKEVISEVIDGDYFLKILKKEQCRLLKMASDAENHLEELSSASDPNDEILGLLRAASGKARLLVSQKMEQFAGLCRKNLNPLPEDKFPTTIADLQGFWDMVQLQISHVNSLFLELEQIKNNNWKNLNDSKPLVQKPVKETTKQLKQKASSNTPNSAAAIKRDLQRKDFLEMKRRNRNKMLEESSKTLNNDKNLNSAEIFSNDN